MYSTNQKLPVLRSKYRVYNGRGVGGGYYESRKGFSKRTVDSQSSICPTFKSLQNKYSVLSIDKTESEDLPEAAMCPFRILQQPKAEAVERPPKRGRSEAAEHPPNPKVSKAKAKEEKTSKKLDT